MRVKLQFGVKPSLGFMSQGWRKLARDYYNGSAVEGRLQFRPDLLQESV